MLRNLSGYFLLLLLIPVKVWLESYLYSKEKVRAR